MLREQNNIMSVLLLAIFLLCVDEVIGNILPNSVSVHLSTTIIGLVILIGIMLIMITVCSIIVLLLLVELYVKRLKKTVCATTKVKDQIDSRPDEGIEMEAYNDHDSVYDHLETDTSEDIGVFYN